MATPNYNYEKRQRELAKKKKKEEKLKEREERKTASDGELAQADQKPQGNNPPILWRTFGNTALAVFGARFFFLEHSFNTPKTKLMLISLW